MPASASLLLASLGVRVASLDLCADEYLLLLARREQITSVSRLSHDPLDSALWRRARRFAANDGRLESVLPRRPQLLLTTSGAGKSTEAIARRAGITLIRLPYAQTIEDVDASMVRVARALGDARRADPWRHRLARLKAGRRGKRDAIFLGGGGLSLPSTSLGAQWMALAGLRQRSLPGGRATLEILATRPPAVLLQSTYRRQQFSLGQQWLAHPLARHSPARVIATDGRPWTCSGPMMVGEIERLQGLR